MQKNGMVRYHGNKHSIDPAGTAENKGVNEMQPGTGFPDHEKEKKDKNAGKGNGSQSPLPLL